MLKIAVCMKSVLNNTTEAAREGNIARNVKNSTMNPFDLYALETALSIPSADGREISVFTMGEQTSGSALLTEACKLGADKLYLISDHVFAGSDTYVTASILTKALRLYGPFDLILCGERAIDGETGQVPGALSAMLDIPYTTCVVGLQTVSPHSLLCHCRREESVDTVSIPLPCILGISCGMEGIHHPVVPSLKGLRRAHNIRIELLDNSLLDFPPEKVGIAGSPTRVVKTTRPSWNRECQMFSDTEAGVDMLLSLLNEAMDGRNCL